MILNRIYRNAKFTRNFFVKMCIRDRGNSNVKPYSYLEKFSLKTFSTTGSSSEGRYLDGKAQLRYTLNPCLLYTSMRDAQFIQ